MGIPFKNGQELANALGYGKLYAKSKELENSEMMEGKTIALTEEDLHNIVKESVTSILNEIGDTARGQKALGALQARKVINANGDTVDKFFDNQSEEGLKVYNYAKPQRSKLGKDSDEFGNTVNPLYKEYSKGYHEYVNGHPEEMAKRMDRLRKLGYPNI